MRTSSLLTCFTRESVKTVLPAVTLSYELDESVYRYRRVAADLLIVGGKSCSSELENLTNFIQNYCRFFLTQGDVVLWWLSMYRSKCEAHNLNA